MPAVKQHPLKSLGPKNVQPENLEKLNSEFSAAIYISILTTSPHIFFFFFLPLEELQRLD